MALIDAGARTATLKAATDLVCSGVTFWDFRPIVEENGAIGWKLLQSLIEIYRSEREGPPERADAGRAAEHAPAIGALLGAFVDRQCLVVAAVARVGV